jgi:hypothetical protein
VAARSVDPKNVAAAWLHDVIEDCGIAAEDLAAARISDEVTAPSSCLPDQKQQGRRILRGHS